MHGAVRGCLHGVRIHAVAHGHPIARREPRLRRLPPHASIVGQSDAEVRLNGNLVTTVRPGQTTDIDQHIQGLRGQAYVPPMPWDVKVTRVSDGAVLLTIHLTDDGTDGRFFQVGEVPDAVASGVAYVCGRLPV